MILRWIENLLVKINPQLSCNHNFRFYHTSVEYDHRYPTQHIFEFMCPQCKKELSVSEWDIQTVYEQMTKQYDRCKVLNEYENIEPIDFTIPGRGTPKLYTGIPATLTFLHFNKIGVDIRQISDSYKEKNSPHCVSTNGVCYVSGK